MPRIARKLNTCGIYHIIMRGINRQSIFIDEYDYERFINIVKKYKEKCNYQIYAYCLMSNHIHLLIKVGTEPLEQLMRRICGSFVYWYNIKYKRVGNLFQDRFKSECIDNDSYFLTVLRYIHQNPIRAGIEATVENCKWTSYNEYVSKSGLIEPTFALDLFNADKYKAISQFIQFNHEVKDDLCLEVDVKEKIRLTDEEAIKMIIHKYKLKSAFDLQGFVKADRDAVLKELKQSGLSVRQIMRITGISSSIAARA